MMICDQCQLESEREEIFRKVSRLFKKDLILCLGCADKYDTRAKTRLLWRHAICGLLAIPLALFPYTDLLGLLLLNIAVLELFIFLSTVLHELGHALAGKLVGFRIFRVEIGKGRVVYEFCWAGQHWQIRSLPFGGLTYGTPVNRQLFRTKQFLFVLGGPACNVILLLVAMKLRPLDQVFKPTVFYLLAPAFLLTLANVILLFYSLMPHMVDSTAGRTANDGLLLLKIWQYKEAAITESLVARHIMEFAECHRKKDLPGMQKWITDGLQQFPGNLLLKYSEAQILFEQKKYREAVRAFALLVGRQTQSSDLDSHILNSIAYIYVLMGKPQFWPRADICSRLALENTPWNMHYKGTRGCVLVELGRYEEGLNLMHEAMRNLPEKHVQARAFCHIGIAEARRGNLVESQNYFTLARKLDPHCPLLERQPQPLQCPPG